MGYERDVTEASSTRGGLLRPASAGQAIEKTQGSLAAAFEQLNREVGCLEESCKALFDRVGPFLEPAPPSNESTKEPARGGSPLADSVFEYASRVRRVRRNFEEIAQRIAY